MWEPRSPDAESFSGAATASPPLPAHRAFQKLLRFPARKGLVGSKPYLTLLSIDEHNLYYQGKDRVSCPEGSRTGIMLYNLK